jgi:hypothetical protein
MFGADFYISKFIDMFQKVPKPFQRQFFLYIMNKHETKEWSELFQDEYSWLDLLKSILLHWSGLAGMGQPSPNDFVDLIIGFTDSEFFMKATCDVERGDKTFAELLEDK